jgi:hypothetical protein
MWEFYLAGCEVAFRYMNQMVFRAQLRREETERRKNVAGSMAAE